MAQKSKPETKTVAQNRRARFDYAIEDTLEAGIVLMGSEVKSLRRGEASITEAYATEQRGEMWLLNAHIAPYEAGKTFGHAPRRPRKLLLHRREMTKLIGAVRRDGMTIVPLAVFFNARGIAKVLLGLAKGRKKADQRHAIKERDWQRQKSRLLRTARE
ncbi:MAG: SsrA-binding protein SmpB [Defluviicoccus sp.]|nr:MAG: SsrA-binding protein SmpB [Defluviicoccus sp.]